MKEQCERKGISGRRQARRAERREAILNVAQKSFFENGYAGTTMSGISASLGGSKSTLWQYFPSKIELFTAVIDNLAKQSHITFTDILNTKADVRTVISLFCKDYISLICSSEVIEFHRLIIAETNRFPELGTTFFARAVDITKTMLSNFIDRRMVTDVDKSIDADAAAELLMSLCHGQCFQKLIFGLADFVRDDEIARDVEISIKAFMKTFGDGLDHHYDSRS